MEKRPRHGQWVSFRLKGDRFGEKADFLGKQGCARNRAGKLVGIYQRAMRHSDVVMIPPDGPEQVQGGWLPERIMLVDVWMGGDVPLAHAGRQYKACYLHRDAVEQVEAVLDRAELPPGRYVPPGFVFVP